ncbi:MAG: protein kinase [Candidatus Riflebacteria bacterium]|nr:protein kinase [Candidatus Riflebacteria bacterium]
MPTHIGKKAGNYTIISKLGDGGFATVYLAQHNVLEKKVAIKFLLEEWITETDVIDRFFDEARTMERLKNHSNIVSIIDIATKEICEKEGLPPYFIMEFIDGVSLEKKIHADEGFTLEFILQVCKCTLSALAHCHKVDASFVHRDIKPSNILIDNQGVVKLTDFGIVKAKANTAKTGEGLTLGSTDYMSPEQALGKRDIDHRSDIYSFGVTLYEMVVGKLPFIYDNPNSVALAHIQEQPLSPIQVNDAIPRRLNDIIMKAMAKPREDRYQTAAEMLDALEHLNDPEPETTSEAKSLDLSQVKSELPEDAIKDSSSAISALENKKSPLAQKTFFSSISGYLVAIVLCVLFTAIFLGAFKFYQNSTQGTLKVKTSPDGALVLINNKNIGTSPISLNLDEGAFKLSLTLDGYQAENLRIDVAARKILTIQKILLKDSPEIKAKFEKLISQALSQSGKKKPSKSESSFQETWKQIEQTLDETPTDQTLHLFLFDYFKKSERLAQGLDFYRKKAENDPKNVFFLTMQAKLMMEMNKTKNVLDILTKAWDIDSNNTLLLNTLGDYYLKDGKKEQAKQYYQLSIFLDSNQNEINATLKGL